MKSITINIAKDFSQFPAGITLEDGEFSGEAFRMFLLEKCTLDVDVIIINLDGTNGYGSSWLKAAFGYLDGEMETSMLKFFSHDSSLITEIYNYISGE